MAKSQAVLKQEMFDYIRLWEESRAVAISSRSPRDKVLIVLAFEYCMAICRLEFNLKQLQILICYFNMRANKHSPPNSGPTGFGLRAPAPSSGLAARLSERLNPCNKQRQKELEDMRRVVRAQFFG